MDQIYFWIIILFLIILFLDYCEKNYKNNKIQKENFINLNESISNSTMPPYYEEDRLNVFYPINTSNSININNKNLNFKNFGTSGQTPPYLKCPSCNLQFQCSDYPYEVDDKNQNVCHNCYEKITYDNNNFPVYAKSVGKPRVCRNLR